LDHHCSLWSFGWLGNPNFRVADDPPGMWKVTGHFYVQRDRSVRMGIGKGRALPGYFVDAVGEGVSL
jgi:hypothetical protein